MVHDAHGWWIADAGAPARLPALSGDVDADVVVIGGGYAGLWTAWHVVEAEPSARVVVLEADRCGFGPSGRNGGFLSSLWMSLPLLRDRFGELRARELCEASADSVRSVGAWCGAEGVDAWYHEAAHLVVSTAPAQDAAKADAVDGREVVALSREEVQAICASPVFRGGVAARAGATVHPARLAFGLRERLLARGVRIHEGSRVRALRVAAAGPGVAPSGVARPGVARPGVAGPGVAAPGVVAPGVVVPGVAAPGPASPRVAAPVTAETASGRVRAGAAVVAVNAASGQLRPLRKRLTVSSSHIVLTEPVPDVVEALGWTGGEAISDGRALLHYFRATRDGRILFGWGGGRMAAGARTAGRMDVDPDVIAQVRRDLVRTFPLLAGRRIEHAWGGPIDVSPTHLPAIVTLPGGRAWATFGFTGNGVGPAHLAGRALASLALSRRDAPTRWAMVDPPPKAVPREPFRVAGATAIRAALARKEAVEEDGRRAGPLVRGLAGLPKRMGIHIVR